VHHRDEHRVIAQGGREIVGMHSAVGSRGELGHLEAVLAEPRGRLQHGVMLEL